MHKNKKNKKNKKVCLEYGFWKSDKFPFVLSSPGEMQDDGWFEAERYGGAAFKPCKVLSLEEGTDLATELIALRADYDKTLNSVRAGFRARLNDLAPFALKDFTDLDVYSFLKQVIAPESLSTATEPPKGRKSVGKRVGK
jgi:hypothetical protein